MHEHHHLRLRRHEALFFSDLLKNTAIDAMWAESGPQVLAGEVEMPRWNSSTTRGRWMQTSCRSGCGATPAGKCSHWSMRCSDGGPPMQSPTWMILLVTTGLVSRANLPARDQEHEK